MFAPQAEMNKKHNKPRNIGGEKTFIVITELQIRLFSRLIATN